VRSSFTFKRWFYDRLFRLAWRKYADSGGKSGLGYDVEPLDGGKGAEGGSQERVSSPYFGDSICGADIRQIILANCTGTDLDHIG